MISQQLQWEVKWFELHLFPSESQSSANPGHDVTCTYSKRHFACYKRDQILPVHNELSDDGGDVNMNGDWPHVKLSTELLKAREDIE